QLRRLLRRVTVGHQTKWEYLRAIYERHRQAGHRVKHVILNEFCLNTGYHRKYAIRLLNGPPPGKQPVGRARRRALRYGQETLSILTAVWEAAGYPCAAEGAVADLHAVDAKA